MADIPHKEEVDNSENTQSKNLLNEDISTNKNDELISNQEIEIMEVHHHPNLHHKPKKLKEYFLEFLMIFLAVTMGFLAENIREHIKDNNEIDNDMQSMAADLKADVAMYQNTKTSNELSDRRIDTLITLLKTDRSNPSEIYFLARYITANNAVYTPGTKTFDLMKSLGALKLVEPRWLLDSISAYYQSLQFFATQSDFQNQKITDIHLVNSQLFDGYIFQQMFLSTHAMGSITGAHIAKPLENAQLLSNDFAIINKIIVAYHYLYATIEINNAFAESHREQANRLINLITKEYHLRDD